MSYFSQRRERREREREKKERKIGESRMAENSIPKPSRRFVSLWILPPGSKPMVRVEVGTCLIKADKLFHIGCDTLGLCPKSRSFFGLFKCLLFPSKKYGTEEIIYLPCKHTLSIQKWSFDIVAETRVIKTDQAAFRLLALQVTTDVDLKRMKPTEEEQNMLQELCDPQFFSHKQYVEAARHVKGYNTVTILDAVIVQKVKLISNVLQKGSKVDIICGTKKITFASS